VILGHEGQDATLALNDETIRIGDDLNRVNVPARKAIDRVEHLERANQIEFIDGRHGDDDDPSAWVVARHA
jgi:hypothetical protein